MTELLPGPVGFSRSLVVLGLLGVLWQHFRTLLLLSLDLLPSSHSPEYQASSHTRRSS